MERDIKRVRLLLFLFLSVLVVLYIIPRLKNVLTHRSTILFSSSQKKDIFRLLIVSTSGKTEIFRINNHWFIKKQAIQYPANTDRIQTLIDSLLSLRNDEIVSRNPKKHSEFDLGKTYVELYFRASPPQKIYIGKPYDSTYNFVRLNNQAEVLLAPGLNDVYQQADFRDLNVNLVKDISSISWITLEKNNIQSFSLIKKNRDWYIDDDKIKQEKIDYYFNDLKTLHASDMFLKDEAINQNQGIPYVLLKIQENNTIATISIIEKDKDSYYLSSTTSPFIYVVPKVYIASLDKEKKDFVE